MRKNIGKIISVIALIVSLASCSITVFAASFDRLSAYGVDTLAGYSSLLSTSKTYPNKDVYFVVTKPDGSKLNIPGKTNISGVAKLDLYDYHTRKAGEYMVSARFSEDPNEGAASSFNVYPDQVSLEQSTIGADKNLAKADGNDAVYVTASVKDQYGNPFQGHLISIISSRSEDTVKEPNSNATDENGSVTFTVTSSKSGASVFSAVDSTAGVVFSARAQVAFLNNGSSLADAGGQLSGYIPVAAAADAGPLHHFEIGGLPATINPNQNVSFSVTAQDSENVAIQNYTGTVHFSVEGSGGENVNLPEDYSFKAEDLGTHTFSLGLSFTQAGTYKIAVTDISNTVIKGQATVTAGSGGSGSTQQSTGQKPVILTPAAGSYSQSEQTVSGSADKGATIKIYDTAQEIGSVQAGQDGKFSYLTNPLADGKHDIYVVAMDSSQKVLGTSDTVQITVDTTPPTVDEIQINPTEGIVPGIVIDVKILSEENLTQAATVFNGEISPLTPVAGQPGAYSGQITAPADAGAYGVDVVLVDQLNNDATYKSKATVNVSPAGGSVETPATEQTQVTQETQGQTQETQAANTNLPPTQVFGLIAYGSDKRVTLVWEAANDDKKVSHYRIYYGLDPANLDKVVNTSGAAATWYVPSLENGKEYYFAVTAIDDEGAESINKSEFVSAIPFNLEVTTAIPERPAGALGDGLHGAAIEGAIPPEMSKNGPEVIWLMYGTGLMSGLVQMIRRKTRKK